MKTKKKIIFNKIILFFFNIIILFSQTFYAGIDCKDILQFLYQGIDVKNILKKNVFNTYGSSGFNYRSIVTMPVGLYYNNQDAFFNNAAISFFYTHTPRGIVLGNSASISTVLNSTELVNLYNDTVLGLLQHTPYASIDIPFLGEAFNYISIIQKRLGCLVQGGYEIKDNVLLYLQLPFTYVIYYPFMPSELQAVITMEVAQFSFNKNNLEKNIIPQVSARDVIINHSVFDTFGLEKSIIGLCYKCYDEMINLDFRIFIPGKDIVQNSIGGNFEEAKLPLPSLPLKNLFINLISGLSINEAIFSDLKKTLLGGVDRVVIGSYYNPFSYQGAAVSPSFLCHFPCGNNFFIDCYLSYVYNFSQNRVGCVMHNDSNNINTEINFDTISNADACKELNILMQVLENKIVPLVCEGVFVRGAEYQAMMTLRSTITDINVGLGVDWWHQDKSQFYLNNSFADVINCRLAATQLNAFGNFEYYATVCFMPMTIQVVFQLPIYAEGIAKEYAAKIQLSMQY